MKGYKVEGSKFISVYGIRKILETHLFKFGAKMVPKSSLEGQNGTMGAKNDQDGAKWIP